MVTAMMTGATAPMAVMLMSMQMILWKPVTCWTVTKKMNRLRITTIACKKYVMSMLNILATLHCLLTILVARSLNMLCMRMKVKMRTCVALSISTGFLVVVSPSRVHQLDATMRLTKLIT